MDILGSVKLILRFDFFLRKTFSSWDKNMEMDTLENTPNKTSPWLKSLKKLPPPKARVVIFAEQNFWLRNCEKQRHKVEG
jgi:hypothetical protein